MGVCAGYQLLPLMVSCIIATLLATRLKEESIYTLKLLRRGVDIHKGKALNVLQHVAGTPVPTLAPDDVIERYNAEIFKRDMAQEMVSAVSHGHAAEPVPTLGDTSVAEIPVPRHFIGKSIGALGIRQRYGVSILVVKQSTGGDDERHDTAPDASYAFREGDVMLVMGPNDNIRSLETQG